MEDLVGILRELEERRTALGMSCQALAKRAGLSLRTVQRALRGEEKGLRLGTLLALASALGARLSLCHRKRIRAMRRRQARKKAQKLVNAAQATSALEGQAVADDALEEMRKRLEDRLAVAPSIRLWS